MEAVSGACHSGLVPPVSQIEADIDAHSVVFREHIISDSLQSVFTKHTTIRMNGM